MTELLTEIKTGQFYTAPLCEMIPKNRGYWEEYHISPETSGCCRAEPG